MNEEEKIIEEDLKTIERRKEAKIRIEELEEFLKLFEWMFENNANKDLSSEELNALIEMIKMRITHLKNF